MKKETLRKARQLQEDIYQKERELRNLEEAIFSSRDLEDDFDPLSLICSCPSQEFRYHGERIFITKDYIVDRLKKAEVKVKKELEQLKKEFDEL